jgi:hypothetical protein
MIREAMLIIIALTNCIFAYQIWIFVKKAVPLIKDIERNTKVVKTHILLERLRAAKAELAGAAVRNSVKDEEHFRGQQ